MNIHTWAQSDAHSSFNKQPQNQSAWATFTINLNCKQKLTTYLGTKDSLPVSGYRALWQNKDEPSSNQIRGKSEDQFLTQKALQSKCATKPSSAAELQIFHDNYVKSQLQSPNFIQRSFFLQKGSSKWLKRHYLSLPGL